MPLNGRGGNESFALPDPDLFTAWALRSVLADSGIAVLGAHAIHHRFAAEPRRAPGHRRSRR